MVYDKANQSILLVSRPPIFKVLCGRAMIIHYSICHFEGVASWNGGCSFLEPPKELMRRGWHFKAIMKAEAVG